jgi:hypothetical protein
LDDLLGTFLKLGYGRFRSEGKRIDWIHPSYRDLVIDELASNRERQLSFLERVSTNGVKLALSLSGGGSGEREMPLVTTDESWVSLSQRCREIVGSEDTETVTELLDILGSALKAEDTTAPAKARVEPTLRDVCDAAAKQWNERCEPLEIDALRSFFRACGGLVAPPTFPDIESTWESSSDDVRGRIRSRYLWDPFPISCWSEVADLIEEYYPEFAESGQYRDTRAAIESDLFELADEFVDNGPDLEDPESNDSEGRRLEQFAEALSRLDRDGSRDRLVDELYGLAQEYRENGPQEEEEYYDAGGGSRNAAEFDVDALFEDL